jgi:glycosyltransferase involved in cell wall biosynthesis
MIDKLKVLIDTTPLTNANQTRGVGTYTRLLAQELEQLPEIKLERTTHKTSQGFKPDVIHYPFFDLFFPTLPLRKKNKTVVTIHDLIPLKFPEHYKPGVRGEINWKRQQLALKNVKAIITDSHASKDDIVELLNVPQEKVEVVYLAGNPDIVSVGKKEISKVRKEYGLPQEYVLYVGDINYNKNLVQLIKSLRFIPEKCHLVLFGKNFKEQDIVEWDWIKTQISLSDVASRVHFVNDVTVGDTLTVSAIYSGALCYAQPSLYEGFGLPVLEAMQAKVPVVSTKNSSLREVGGKHVVYVEESAEQIADGIKHVMSWSDDERSEKIEQAFDWTNSFSWEKAARETVRVYQEVVQS